MAVGAAGIGSNVVMAAILGGKSCRYSMYHTGLAG
jgi:hypothetical protein